MANPPIKKAPKTENRDRKLVNKMEECIKELIVRQVQRERENGQGVVDLMTWDHLNRTDDQIAYLKDWIG